MTYFIKAVRRGYTIALSLEPGRSSHSDEQSSSPRSSRAACSENQPRRILPHGRKRILRKTSARGSRTWRRRSPSTSMKATSRVPGPASRVRSLAGGVDGKGGALGGGAIRIHHFRLSRDRLAEACDGCSGETSESLTRPVSGIARFVSSWKLQ
jgi:hypothetical protein